MDKGFAGEQTWEGEDEDLAVSDYGRMGCRGRGDGEGGLGGG